MLSIEKKAHSMTGPDQLTLADSTQSRLAE